MIKHDTFLVSFVDDHYLTLLTSFCQIMAAKINVDQYQVTMHIMFLFIYTVEMNAMINSVEFWSNNQDN